MKNLPVIVATLPINIYVDAEGRVQDYTNISLRCRLRFWLIKRLAGKSIVMLNARLENCLTKINYINIYNTAKAGVLIGDCQFEFPFNLTVRRDTK